MCCLLLIKVEKVKIFGMIIVISVHCKLSYDNILYYSGDLNLMQNRGTDYKIMVPMIVSDSAGTQPE